MVDEPTPEASGPEDFLTETALNDPGEGRDDAEDRPTFWRVVVLILVAVVALSVVFGIAR